MPPISLQATSDVCSATPWRRLGTYPIYGNVHIRRYNSVIKWEKKHSVLSPHIALNDIKTAITTSTATQRKYISFVTTITITTIIIILPSRFWSRHRWVWFEKHHQSQHQSGSCGSWPNICICKHLSKQPKDSYTTIISHEHYLMYCPIDNDDKITRQIPIC